MCTTSVIIIAYNAAPFLLEAIHSVRSQSVNDWELLVVDDGSDDESGDIARQCAHAEPQRITYLEHQDHKNQGMSASRDLGLQYARGRYVCFLDADDVFQPHALRDQVAVLEAHPEAAMTYGSLYYWYGWTGNPADIARDRVRGPGIPPETLVAPPDLLVHFLRRRVPSPSGAMVRREVIDAVGGYERDFPGMYEDQAFAAKICLKWPVYVANGWWYKYRQHPNSSSAIADSLDIYEYGRAHFLQWLRAYLRQQQNVDNSVLRSLQYEMWLYAHPRVQRLHRYTKRRIRRIMSKWSIFSRANRG